MTPVLPSAIMPENTTGQCVMDKLPGVLSELTGTDVPEYSFIAPDAGAVTVDWEDTQLTANVFADQLEAVGDAKVVGTYTSDYYAGAGALVCRALGKGKAYYYGSAFNEESARIFLEKLGVASPYRALVEVPESCELAVRSKDGEKYLFVLNYEPTPAEITLHQSGTDLYTGETVSGAQKLDGYGTMVIRL